MIGDREAAEIVERIESAGRLLASIQQVVDSDPSELSGESLRQLDGAVNALQGRLTRCRSSVRRAAASRPTIARRSDIY